MDEEHSNPLATYRKHLVLARQKAQDELAPPMLSSAWAGQVQEPSQTQRALDPQGRPITPVIRPGQKLTGGHHPPFTSVFNRGSQRVKAEISRGGIEEGAQGRCALKTFP